MFKLTINDGEETVKTQNFDNCIYGTLIIWSAVLNG